MEPGERVSVPDRRNWNAGDREPATLISPDVQQPGVVQGPPVAPIRLWRVRYEDGATAEVPEGVIETLS
jgi:hypothetical protein